MADASEKTRHLTTTTPPRWHEYSCYGEPLAGLRVLAVKVPLSQELQKPDAPAWTMSDLVVSQRKLGRRVATLVNLAYSEKYYLEHEPADHGISYHWIPVAPRFVPPRDMVQQFVAVVQATLQAAPDAWVAVHCAHGVNRTGFFLAALLAEQYGWGVNNALHEVQRARGHNIIRPYLVDGVRAMYPASRFPHSPKTDTVEDHVAKNADTDAEDEEGEEDTTDGPRDDAVVDPITCSDDLPEEDPTSVAEVETAQHQLHSMHIDDAPSPNVAVAAASDQQQATPSLA